MEAIADAALDGARKTLLTTLSTVLLLIIDDLGMRKLPPTAAEDLLEIVMRRYERDLRARVKDWRALLGRQVPIALRIVTKLLDGRLVFTPRKDRAYEFTGRVSIGRLLQGIVLPSGGRP